MSGKFRTIGNFTVTRPAQILPIYRQNLGSESSGSTMKDTVFICEGQGRLETSILMEFYKLTTKLQNFLLAISKSQNREGRSVKALHVNS